MVADNGVVHAIDRVMIPAQFTQSRRKIQVLSFKQPISSTLDSCTLVLLIET